MHLLNPALLFVSALVSRVAAHGVVISIKANGKTYAGEPNPYQPTAASPIRAVSNNGPVTDVTDKHLACGNGNKVATMDVPVDAGSVATVQWTKPWPHLKGPIMTYLASCGEACSKVTDPTSLNWFKIDQLGAPSDNDTAWVQDTLLCNQPVQITIPSELKPGYYMIRHEIIALHLATTQGGAEFYPQCIQVEVKGTGNLVPPSEGIVHFPGAYRANDAGIAIYTAPDNDEHGYNVNKFYKFPGGPIPQLTPDSGDSGSSATSSASASDGPSSTGLSSATSSSEDATSSAGATQSAMGSVQPTSTSETPASATAAVSGSCHAKRGSIKRRRI
ncbi:lytic polysaccharide monooxygenase [Polyporus arcularius HHB13444]|uniref:lytic cellulose monooxygenase (C4-dehydrogenating) n=1 Tax=Polyporus arcularius HHB13444 TaxID=1314778 RepID=A0A5C3Q7X8_9APHY|nr:lytic polysaccharide monooxygenase [Polyporus arcularius HHB13444]